MRIEYEYASISSATFTAEEAEVTKLCFFQQKAIVGTVGSGKTSMLSAMLGELEKVSGRVNTQGTIGYVAQQAWIQNVTLR
jgi:ABC-type Mn2+/Zn2+ transport system ATPase subunit